MRKLKNYKVEKSKVFSNEDIIFFGIIRICLFGLNSYIGLLNDPKSQFYFNDNGIHSPYYLITTIQKLIFEIGSSCDKPNWSAVEIAKVRARIASYYEILEDTVGISTRKEIEDLKIFIEDYELLTTLITTKEFLKEEREAENVNETNRGLIKKLIPKISELCNILLNDIWFGAPQNPKKQKIKNESLEVLINDKGALIKREGYYNRYCIRDNEDIKYPAGISKEGYLYVMDADKQEWILNNEGERLEWSNTRRGKKEALSCIYKIGNNEIVTNIRKHNFEVLIKECNKAGIENIDIIKTLIEMKGFNVERA